MGGPDSIVICDTLNVLSNSFLIDTANLTLATNTPNSPTLVGSINLENSAIVWSTSTPRLQNLTNFGFITTANAVYFGGSRSAPYYNTNFNEPYWNFINRGGITNNGTLIWATNFLNTGTFLARSGGISLQKAQTTWLTNGAFLAPGAGGAINIESGSLYSSNYMLQGNGPLTLSITNLLDDGSLSYSLATMTNKNTWSCSGFSLLSVPTIKGSLLASTITNINPSYSPVRNYSALPDLGPAPTAFSSNSAVGHLILVGQNGDSLFTFSGTGVSNALYVDELDFRGSTATNVDTFKNYIGVQIDPNMKIYYGQALGNGVSIAERLNGKNNGRFVWVSNYNTGFFSSTNVVYPDGTTNQLNAALVASCDLDSNTNGIPNCLDPAPIYIPPVLSPANLALAVNYSTQPGPAAVVSWNAFPLTTNALLAAPSFTSTNWQVVTNFVYTRPYMDRVTVTDLIKTNGPRFYRIRVTTP